MKYFKLRITHLQAHFKLPRSDLKSQNDSQNDQSIVKRVFSQGCEIRDFRAFGLSPASVGALFEAVGAQQRKRKCKLVVRSTLLHLSLQRGPSGKIQGFASLHYICHFMSAVILDFPDKLRQCQKSF